MPMPRMRSQALLSWRGPYGGDEGVASASTVGRTLGLSADIHTSDNISSGRAASYEDDLSELPIPSINPD